MEQNRQSTSNSQILSIKKFERYEIKYYHSCIYALLFITLALPNRYMNKNDIEKVMNIIMAIITSFSTWFFSNELLCHIKPLRKKLFKILIRTPFFNIYIMDLISMIFTFVIEFLWLYFDK